MKERYAKRCVKAIDQLGGKCIDCGLIVLLEFDHIDPAIKNASIAKHLSHLKVTNYYKLNYKNVYYVVLLVMLFKQPYRD